MIKIIFLILLFFIGCTPSPKPILTGVNFNQVLKNENLSDSEKIIELKIQISKQEDKILKIKKNTINLENLFDSLKSSNDSVTFFLESQIDSFRIEQSMLIGPEFSNNIIKLYNKVNILEDRAFFMDSLYFELVTDMIIIENEISSIEYSIKEIDSINKKLKSKIDYKKDSNLIVIDYSYDYKVAHQMYMRGNFDASLNKFKFLLENNISKDLADNCQFWIGQIFFSKKEYLNAIEEFNKVLKYKDSNKKSESIYKIGLSHIKTGNNNKAKKMFQKIINNYPKSKYYSKASEILLTLR
jgi:tol-pal system protein YbgF